MKATRQVVFHRIPESWKHKPEWQGKGEYVCTIRNPQISKDGKRIPVEIALKYIDKYKLAFEKRESVWEVVMFKYNNEKKQNSETIAAEMLSFLRP